MTTISYIIIMNVYMKACAGYIVASMKLFASDSIHVPHRAWLARPLNVIVFFIEPVTRRWRQKW